MSKIGDLFVRLGLKKDEFSKGIKDAKRESSSFVDSLKNIGAKGKIAFAAVAAAVVAVVSAVKELAKQNQTLGVMYLIHLVKQELRKLLKILMEMEILIKKQFQEHLWVLHLVIILNLL